jgi:Leucine-rich repeat (LRR) protein
MISYKDNQGVIHEEKYSNDDLKINLSFKNITQILNISGLQSLEELRLDNNQITEITCLDGLTNLRTLWLFYNQITEIKGLDKLCKLQDLRLFNNNIKDIKGLNYLTELQYLWIDNNQITEIKELEKLTRLKYLFLSQNKITKITGLDKLTRLEIVWLSSNKITHIEGLDSLINLQSLMLHNNEIKEIKGIYELTNLKDLSLNKNKITSVPYRIMNLRNLTYLSLDFCVSTIIERFLDRNQIKDNKTIYDDSQNVHDSNIARTIKQSIYNIIDETKKINIDLIMKEILNDKILNEITKRQFVEYCRDKTVHSNFNLTFEEVLCSVWNIISEHKEQDEIKRILNEEMKDSICKCFTGRLSRLVNCLNGFDSRVSIKINDKQQILNVIIKIRNKYDDIDKQKKEVIKELTDRGYDESTINEYIFYLE